MRINNPPSRFDAISPNYPHAQADYSKALFEANFDAIVVTDPVGTISDVNEKMVQISGRTRSDLIGLNWFDLIPNTDKAGIEYARALAKGNVSNVELLLKSSAGTEIPILYNAAPIYDRQNNLVGVFATLRDGTDLMQLKYDLNVKNYEACSANQIKADFLANMSHELRTPLTAILGFSEALLCGILGNIGEEQRGYIQDIHDSGQHLLKLISDILDLAKIDAGSMQINMEAADLADVLLHSVTNFDRRVTAPEISLEIDERAGPIVSQLDLHKTQKILEHMLSNAVKFSAPNGNVRICARRVSRSSVGKLRGRGSVFGFALPDNAHAEFIQLTVEDDGIGIRPHKLPQVFQVFSQIDSGLERQFEGVGLGATMVQRLAKLLGGTAAIASSPGKGTTCAVWLPIYNVPMRSSIMANFIN